MQIAFQKFLGLVADLEDEHDLDGPILMDATVEQRDGFRFFYTLPFTKRKLLVEDTRYSDTAELDRDELRSEIRTYCETRGWRIRNIAREEQGALPIVLSGNLDELLGEGGDVPTSGVRAGLFHHTTGYSFPEAVRLADDLAAHRSFSSDSLREILRVRTRAHWSRQRFFRLLNRMMFRAAEPSRRYRVLEHFYRLPESLVERFYAGRLSWRDRVRILVGKPPVPAWRALRSVFDS
jgi:lycopene beta-cyclase